MIQGLQRMAADQWPLVVQTPMGVQVEGSISGIDVDRSRLLVELSADPPPLQPGDALELFLHHQGQRWAMSAPLHHFPRPTSLVLRLPQAIRCADRRQEPRWAVPAGVARASVSTTLFEGLQVEGELLSLSAGGFAFRAERLQGPEGPRAWDPALLPPGRTLEGAQIQGFPFALEGEGRVLWQERGCVGVLLRGLPPEAKEALAALVSAKAEAPPTVFALEAAHLPPPALPLTREAPGRSQALLRLKKRGRTLVLAMKGGHLREALRERLLAWGYGRVEGVDSLAQWLEFSQQNTVDLVFIDGGFKELQGLELASFLHQARGEMAYAIVLAEQLEGTSLGLLAKRAGITQLLGKPYTLDERLDAVLEGALDLRPPVVTEAAPMPSSRHKRRAVALAMPPGPKREALQAFLLGEGFSRVLPAGTVAELIRVLQSPTLGLVFVDWEEGSLSGLEVAAFLAGQHGVRRPQLVLAGDARIEEEAHALGIARVVPKGYPLNGPLVRALLEVMEGLEAAV